ncbi:MAG TPA: hypothetical protein DD429_01150 [Clostridiaceae bacterium]|nr:hypothetical protein [Clostridiaceae bacterium]
MDKMHAIPIIIILVLTLVAAVLLMRKTVTVTIDGKPTEIVTYKSTVKEILDDNKISVSSKDKIEPALNSKLSNKGTITIKKAVNITIDSDGKTLKIQSAEENVGSMLSAEGIPLNELDKVNPGKETKLYDGMLVEVVRVETKNVTETQTVKFAEVFKSDKGLANTKSRVIQNGEDGKKEVTYKVTLENGKEVSRELIGEKLIKNPMDRIVMKGAYPLMPVSRDGSMMAYSRIIRARATAYWAVNGVGKTYTASGRKAVRNPDGYSTIAVDRNLMPYGTKVFVEGYGFATAADTGAGIVGEKIDVFFDTYKEACNWGAKYVNVYILR